MKPIFCYKFLRNSVLDHSKVQEKGFHELTGGGGGAAVTDMGHEVLSRYRAMETKARASVSADVLALTALMVKAPEE